jgi:DNA-damage-inducible protein D
MSNENALAVFEHYKIRRVYDPEREMWYFFVVDVVAALTDSINPAGLMV